MIIKDKQWIRIGFIIGQYTSVIYKGKPLRDEYDIEKFGYIDIETINGKSLRVGRARLRYFKGQIVIKDKPQELIMVKDLVILRSGSLVGINDTSDLKYVMTLFSRGAVTKILTPNIDDDYIKSWEINQ